MKAGPRGGLLFLSVLGVASLLAIGLKVAHAARAGQTPVLAAAGPADARALSQLDDELRDLD